MKLEVFRILESCVLAIDRLFSVLMYEFATELMSIAASMLSLLICWVTQSNKIFRITFCWSLNWLNHVFLMHLQVACRCSELIWFFFWFIINTELTQHSETIKILLFIFSYLKLLNAMCNHDHSKEYWIDRQRIKHCHSMWLKCHTMLVLNKDCICQHTWDDLCAEPSFEWLQRCQLMRIMLNSYISHHKQNCHFAEDSQHTSSYSSVLSAAVNHN